MGCDAGPSAAPRRVSGATAVSTQRKSATRRGSTSSFPQNRAAHPEVAADLKEGCDAEREATPPPL